MKKQLFLASALALVTLASCGGGKGGIKVGLICLHDKNSTYDANFIEAFESACEEAKKAGKISGYSYVTDVPEDDACYTAAERFINQGYSIIFSDSYGHDPYMRKAAKDNPNVFFSSATGDQTLAANLPNYHNAFASIYEGRFLAGMAAGQYIKEHKDTMVTDNKVLIGYVGAFNYAEVISGYTSWYLGVKDVLDVEGIKVEMQVAYTGSWYDYEKEYSTAQKLIKNGCKLISQHADSMGAPNACKANDPAIPNVSYNMNTVDMDSTCKDTYVAHSRINWKPYYANVLNTAVGSLIDGEVEHNWTGTLKSGSVEYNVSDLVQDKTGIKKAAEDLANGTKHVFDTSKFQYTVSEGEEGVTVDGDKHLTSYKVNLNNPFVEGDPERIQEIVKDGYVHESEYRSAPSFALIIDGITELTNN